MILIILAALGVTVGYLLGLTRRGVLVMVAVFLGSLALEIEHLLASANRGEMTMGPLVAGLMLAGSMLLGAFSKSISHDDSIGNIEPR
jgi:hypothetical protein